MPLEYKTYGCEFKCGHRHSASKNKIETHEVVCWYNPKNKTCMTCEFGKLEEEYDPHDERVDCSSEYYRWRECGASEEAQEQFNEFQEEQRLSAEDDAIKKMHAEIRPYQQCKYWKEKK